MVNFLIILLQISRDNVLSCSTNLDWLMLDESVATMPSLRSEGGHHSLLLYTCKRKSSPLPAPPLSPRPIVCTRYLSNRDERYVEFTLPLNVFNDFFMRATGYPGRDTESSDNVFMCCFSCLFNTHFIAKRMEIGDIDHICSF